MLGCQTAMQEGGIANGNEQTVNGNSKRRFVVLNIEDNKG